MINKLKGYQDGIKEEVLEILENVGIIKDKGSIQVNSIQINYLQNVILLKYYDRNIQDFCKVTYDEGAYIEWQTSKERNRIKISNKTKALLTE